MKAKLFLPVTLAALYATLSFAQAVKDQLHPNLHYHLSGQLNTTLNDALQNRILAQDAQRLVDAFKKENRTETHLWQSEFWGKWFTSAVLAYQYHPDPALKQTLATAVKGLLQTQDADGYIGNYAPTHHLEQWDIWGRKYCMLGLLAYHQLTGDTTCLNGAIKIADHLIGEIKKSGGLIVNKGNYRGMAASSVLEPVCLLYNVTREKKYLDFAEEIVLQWETPGGPQLISKAPVDVSLRFPKPEKWYSPEQGQKAYEMMSCYEGLIELYRITGNNSYRKAVESVWENIRNTEINIAGSGASAEMWFGGKKLQHQPIYHYQETCVTVTWIKFCLQLLRLTGDAKYADEAERAYYNALLGSMSNRGATWAKYTPLNGQRLPGSEQCGMGLNCCEASGPRALFVLPQYMVTEKSDGAQINFFGEGVYDLVSPGKQNYRLTQSTGYPGNGSITATVDLVKEETFSIYLRIPAWSANTTLSVNGENINGMKAGENFAVRRQWKKGDKLVLQLDFRGRLLQQGNEAKSFAIARGPLVLARDTRLQGPDLIAALQPVTDRDGFVELSRVANSPYNKTAMVFSMNCIPESYTEQGHAPIRIELCEYAAAGNDEKNSFYRVWLPQVIRNDGK